MTGINKDLIEYYKRCHDDLIFYCRNEVKIRTKKGSVEPLILNRAQSYIHDKLEEQKAKTGKVRAIILKARQQGCCYAPDMRVLTNDYRWVQIKDLKLGDKLVACDEYPKSGSGASRKLQTAELEAIVKLKKEVFEVKLDNGVTLKVTGEHRHLCQFRGAVHTEWRTIHKTRIGDKIRYITNPQDYNDICYEDGWFGGILDGEGSCKTNLKESARIAFSQVDGDVLNRAKSYLKKHSIAYYENIDKRTNIGGRSKLGDKPVHCIAINKLGDIIKVLSRTRPSRFINKEIHIGREFPREGYATVVSIKSLGEQEVIDLQTSEKTFICEGIVSHNSTYVAARFFHKTTFNKGIKTFILTHQQEATENLFEMVSRIYEHSDIKPKASTDNAKELYFKDIDSGYKIGTAGSKGVGRSQTIQVFHGSECGFWQKGDEHAAGILQAVADVENTEIIFESTANGIDNFFYKISMEALEGKSEYQLIFVPWFWQDEYSKALTEPIELQPEEQALKERYSLTDEQLNWRRYKIRELGDPKLFCQEYPSSIQEAFVHSYNDPYIPLDLVEEAMRTAVDDSYNKAPVVIGCDPARGGKDETGLTIRQGRKVHSCYGVDVNDTMQICGQLTNLIKQHRPKKIFIDVIGVGAGVVDRMMEMGYSGLIVPVNSAETKSLLYSDRYSNKRAEMWGEMKEWLQDKPVSLPNSEKLKLQMITLSYGWDSKGRLKIQSKDQVDKSPDLADSLALTFAFPVASSAAKYDLTRSLEFT